MTNTSNDRASIARLQEAHTLAAANCASFPDDPEPVQNTVQGTRHGWKPYGVYEGSVWTDSEPEPRPRSPGLEKHLLSHHKHPKVGIVDLAARSHMIPVNRSQLSGEQQSDESREQSTEQGDDGYAWVQFPDPGVESHKPLPTSRSSRRHGTASRSRRQGHGHSSRTDSHQDMSSHEQAESRASSPADVKFEFDDMDHAEQVEALLDPSGRPQERPSASSRSRETSSKSGKTLGHHTHSSSRWGVSFGSRKSSSKDKSHGKRK